VKDARDGREEDGGIGREEEGWRMEGQKKTEFVRSQ
jgi:hypothetical protein